MNQSMESRRGTLRGAVFAVAAMCAASDAARAQIGDFPDQEIGRKVHIRVRDLPAPYATPSVSNAPHYKQLESDRPPIAPPGFSVALFGHASHARWLAVAPNGDVFVTHLSSNKITVLRDADGDGVAEQTSVFHEGLTRPHGMAFQPGYFYVADTRGLWRFVYEPGQLAARGQPERVTPEGAFGDGAGHWTRNIAFSRDGKRVYVSIGSRGNLDEEPAPRATIQEFHADGTGQRTFAAGLRNPVGIAFAPGTDELYAVVNERDGMGDGLVPDYLTRVARDGFYGWSYAYLGSNPQPEYAAKRPDLVARTLVPDVLFKSHSAPLGLVFYDGAQFPAEYRGHAFVALHGSWNSAKPAGYTVVRVPFSEGKPQGHYVIFLGGFWVEGKDRAVVRGRPVGLAVAKDGGLLVADDFASVIWRVSYKK